MLDRFAGQALNWNEALMAHAYALRSLAQQFPDDAALTSADRASLHALVADHLNAMALPAGNVDHAFTPVLAALGAKAPARAAVTPETWQAAAGQLFQSASSVEMLSSTLLGIARTGAANADLPSQLLGAVAALHTALEQDQRLLGR